MAINRAVPGQIKSHEVYAMYYDIQIYLKILGLGRLCGNPAEYVNNTAHQSNTHWHKSKQCWVFIGYCIRKMKNQILSQLTED